MAFDWGSAFKGGAAGGILPGVAAGFIGGGWNDDEKKTNELLDQIPDQLKQYLMPYINAGTGALGRAGTEYGNLLSDPNSIISRIGAGYKESPGYKWRLGQGENAITNAAASGGYAGTAEHQQRAGQLAGDLANQDYENYLSKALGLYGEGLHGNQSLANLGAGTAGDLATSLANILKTKAGLNYQRNLNKNQQMSDMFSSILGLFGNVAKGAAMGGGM